VERKAGLHEAGRLVFEERGAAIEARPDAVAQESPWLKMRARQVARCHFSQVKRQRPSAKPAGVLHRPPGEDDIRVKGSHKDSLEFYTDNKGLSELSELRVEHSL
jgi:hypothetical protein